MAYLINDKPLIQARINLPKIGPWQAIDVIVSSETNIKIGDSVTLQVIDKTFKGTVLDSTASGDAYTGYQRISVQGGSGNMSSLLEPAPYNSTTVGQIVRDIARKTGHTLSNTVDSTLLNQTLVGWNILKMKASLALEKLLEVNGAIWRILPDGTLFIGKENYVPLNEKDFVISEQYPSEGRWSVYNEKYLIEPGTSLSGNNIKHIDYWIDGTDLSMDTYFVDTEADATLELTSQDHKTLYNTVYRCQVVTQHSNGLIDAIPNPSLDVVKNGFVNIKMDEPFPGMSIKVPVGSICTIGFKNGDPQYPMIFGWEDIGNATSVEMIHTNSSPAARKGDLVGGLFLSSVSAMGVMTVSITRADGAVYPLFTVPGGTPLNSPVELISKIITGSSIVSIGT